MEILKITGNGLSQMCRLCLSYDMTMDDIFGFSYELGKEIVDIIMECAPVHITRHDEMPTCICQLCFNQLKKFYQFQVQIVRSDRTLQRYLQQLSDCHPQICAESALEEQSDSSKSQHYNAEFTTKLEPLEINDEFDNLFSKQKVLANFSSVGKDNDVIPIKLEIKDEPMDDDSLIPTECVDTAETLSTYDGNEISCENSMIEIGDTKVGNFECPIKIENETTEKISEETSISGTLCPENVEQVECVRSIADNINKAEDPINRQNLNENSKDTSKLLLNKTPISTGVKPYRCDVCETYFRTVQSLKSHKLKHTGEKPYQCDICKKCFRQSGYLKIHKLKHTGEKPHQCDICKVRFRVLGALQKHTLKHAGGKPYRCGICKMCFRTSQNLRSHKLEHTEEKPYQCDICKMCFKQACLLKYHHLIHTGEKPYQCPVCQRCFRREYLLRSHAIIHTGAKPYRCNICQMRFAHSGQLKTHNRIHTGEKPYQCDICQMCFRQSPNLNSHKLKHTGEKPYQCDFCQMCFRQSNSLKNHRLKHTGEKPHKCDICQMRFRHKNSLKNHNLKHTGEWPFECDICVMRFRHKITLKKHTLKHTG